MLNKDYHSQSIKVHSSMYDNLRTNLPREIMGFSEFPFDASFPESEDPRRFCTHHEVRYLDLRLLDVWDLGEEISGSV